MDETEEGLCLPTKFEKNDAYKSTNASEVIILKDINFSKYHYLSHGDRQLNRLKISPT